MDRAGRSAGGGGAEQPRRKRHKRSHGSASAFVRGAPKIFQKLADTPATGHRESASPWLKVMRNTDVQRKGSVLYLRVSLGPFEGVRAPLVRSPCVAAANWERRAAPQQPLPARLVPQPGSLVAGLPRPGTLRLNALRLQLEARLTADARPPADYPATGNVEWFAPPGCCVYLAVDLERCVGRSQSGRSVVIAQASKPHPPPPHHLDVQRHL